MPRWPKDHVTKRTCPKCGGQKDFYASACRRCTTPGKPLKGVSGENHPAWRGGFRYDRDGYIRTYAPDHPWPRRGGYVCEHVRVMELHIGRRLNKDECAHHIDGDKTNNRLNNLKLMDRGEHSSHHRKRDWHKRQRDELGRFVGDAA